MMVHNISFFNQDVAFLSKAVVDDGNLRGIECEKRFAIFTHGKINYCSTRYIKHLFTP